MVQCQYCSAVFTRGANLKAHIKRVHSYTKPKHICIICKKAFISLRGFNYHKQIHKPIKSKFHVIEHGLHRNCEVYQRVFFSTKTTSEAYTAVSDELKQLLKYQLLQKKTFKCQTVLIMEFVKVDEANQVIEDRCEFYARSSSFFISNLRNVRQFMRQSRLETELRIDDFISHGSGWKLNEVSAINIELGQCRALTGGCHYVNNRKIVIKKVKELNTLLPNDAYFNTSGPDIGQYKKRQKKENDNKCFLYCIAHYFLTQEGQKVTQKKLNTFIKRKLNVKVQYPMKLSSIAKFEKDNAHLNFKVNVLQAHYEGGGSFKVFPLIANTYQKCDNIINVLYFDTLIENDKCDTYNSVQGHFLLIDNLQSFLNYRSFHYQYFCTNCLTGFSRASTLKKHEQFCFQFKPQFVRAPYEWDKIIYFKNFKHQFFSHFIGFFDFEAILRKPDVLCSSCEKDKQMSCIHKTKIEHEQIPISFSIIITDITKKIIFQKVYTGEDCMDVFIDTLLYELEPKLMKILTRNKTVVMTEENKKTFVNSTVCHICKKQFSQDPKSKRRKVLDHNHITGEFMGAAHQDCNLLRQEHKRIPLFCHNFSGYDSHFIMKAFKKDLGSVKLECLPYNTEKFRVINLNQFILLDSANFLNASLDTLSQELHQLSQNGDFDYPILNQSKIYQSHEYKKKEMILKKGFFPYEYLSDISKLQEKKFPPHSAFVSKLKNDQISKANYEHAKQVYKTFHCETFQQYMELYCLTDTILLAEMVWQYRDEIMTDCGLDIW